MNCPSPGFLDREGSRGADILNRGSEMDLVITGGGFPRRRCLIEGGEVVGGNAERESLRLSGSKGLCLAEGLQLTGGFLKATQSHLP